MSIRVGCTMDCVDPSGAGEVFTSGVMASIGAGRNMPAMPGYASGIGDSATRFAGATVGVTGRTEAETLPSARPPAIRCGARRTPFPL